MWCCTVGCGVLDDSLIANVAGGCESLNYVRPDFEPSDYMMKHNYYWTPFTTGGAYGTYCVCLSAGSILKWMKQCFFSDWDDKRNGSFYRYMDEMVGESPTNIVVVPYFSTAGSPLFSTNANGLIDGLKLNTTSFDIYRGIMEGITYSLKENMDILSAAGYSTRTIRSTGGGANSAIWSQIKADVFSSQIEIVSGNEAGTVGAAIIAGVGTGAFDSYREAADTLVKISAVYEPLNKYKDIYDHNYQRFRELRENNLFS